jgi:Uma2 family endonuclease
VRFDVDQFKRMGEAGIFAPDARIELLEGELLTMAPIGDNHAFAVDALNNLLVRQLSPALAIISVQNSAIVSRFSEPQPDVMLLRPPLGSYRRRRPRPADILLLIEVSDTTLQFDRGRKVPVYARSGVPEVWIVDVNAPQLEVFRDPVDTGYRERCIVAPTEMVAPALLQEQPIDWGCAVRAD